MVDHMNNRVRTRGTHVDEIANRKNNLSIMDCVMDDDQASGRCVAIVYCWKRKYSCSVTQLANNVWILGPIGPRIQPELRAAV